MANDINIVVSAQVGDATRGLMQVQKQVQQVDRQIKQSTVALRQHANQFDATAVSTNKFAKGALQQAGYQVGDFAVQLSGGQNALMAFGQQGSQMLGIFGPVGAVLGAAVAIFAAVGAAIQKAASAADNAAPAFKDVSDAASALGSAFDAIEATDVDAFFNSAMSPAVRKLRDEYSGLLNMMNLVAQEERNRAIAGVMQEVGPDPENIRRLQDVLDRMRRASSGPESDFMGAERAQAMAQVTTELAKQQVLTNAINSLNGATRQDALEQLRIVEADLTRKGLMTAELRAQLRDYAQQSGLLSELKSQTEDVTKNTEEAAKQSSDFASAMNDAANAVRNINTSAFAKLQELQSELTGRTRGLGDDQIRIMQAARRAELAAMDAGVDSQTELAAIAAEAAAIERQIIAAEAGIRSFTTSVQTSVPAVQKVASVVKNELNPELKRIVDIQNAVSSSIESGLMAMVDGTQSVKDAFRSMASEIIKELYRIFVVKRITGMITGYIGDNGANPDFFSGIAGAPRSLPARAMGGQVTGGRAYMVGERGPEMIVPQRNGNVVPNNQLGGGGVTVVQNISISTGVQQTVRAEIKTLMPQIAEASKAAVADAVRRGGSYGRAFA